MNMSKFSFHGNDFGVMPEGTYVFGIYEVAYDEEFGRMEVKMVTAKGEKYTERFMLKGAGETVNEPAMNAFVYFAKVALGEYGGRDEFDEQELVGHYIRATVVHTVRQSRTDPSKTVTFANLARDKVHMDGFEEAPCKYAAELMVPKAMAGAQPVDIDLDALLG